MPRFPLALAPFLVVACAAPLPDTRKPLPAGRTVDVRYVSRLAPAEAHGRAQSGAERAAKSEPAEAAPAQSVPEQSADESFVRIDCAQYQVDAGALTALVPSRAARSFAFVAARADVKRVLDARIADGSVQRSARPSLRIRDGGTASMSTTHHQAFVEGFEITRVGSDLVGDPRVATTEEGLTFEVRARLDPAPSIAVEVALKQTELLRPLLEGNVRMPGSDMSIVVQVPLALRQELASAVDLGPDEVLVMGGILDPDGVHDVFVVVDVRRDDGRVAALDGR